MGKRVISLPCSLFGGDLAAVVVERQASAEKDEHDHPESPHVHSLTIREPLEHLRSEVALRTQEGTGHRIVHYLGQSKVDQFHL